MKIKHAEITNPESLKGANWWLDVQNKPDEPLIEATIKMQLSWNEYHELLDRDKTTGSRDL